MLAVVELWWNQFIVKNWDIIEVKKLKKEVWEVFSTNTLLVYNEEWNDVKIWTPEVSWHKVEFKVLEQFKWDKIRVFKMKSKKRYAKNKWFRPSLTRLEVIWIS